MKPKGVYSELLSHKGNKIHVKIGTAILRGWLQNKVGQKVAVSQSRLMDCGTILWEWHKYE